MSNDRSSRNGVPHDRCRTRAGPVERGGGEAAAQAGPPPETSSRSVSSIVAGNVFTLFNAIIGVFFVLILSLGLIADAVFGMVAIINSYIGIRQELKAKRTLDELAVVVAPHARVVRDGEVQSLLAEEVVPGDVIRVEPGDQLVADGEVIRTRGLTLDESLLTGEADGVRGHSASGSVGLLLHLRLWLLRRRRGAGGELRRAAGRRGQDLPPSPLASSVRR